VSSTSTGLKVFSTIKDKVYVTARKVSENFKQNMKIVFDDYLVVNLYSIDVI